MKPLVKVAFASGTDKLNASLTARMCELFPELPLYVVSEFPPQDAGAQWIPYRVNRSFSENLARCRAALEGKSIRLAGVLLVPNVPYRRMRLMALVLAPLHFLAVNENLNDFMLRPGSAGAIARHCAWRGRNFLRWHFGPKGTIAHGDLGLWLLYAKARLAGALAPRRGERQPMPLQPNEPGISLVIPSRNGKDLLAAQMPAIVNELPSPAEIIVVDNGSDDGTAEWLRVNWPQIHAEVSEEPLSFAEAVNRGIARARCARICLLNNDMLVEPGFFVALERAFEGVPDLFCATAQIHFPEGQRREETGKAVMARTGPTDFPVRCEEPAPGEDLTYVLYGSGGCSLYDAMKLRALGGMNPEYAPAYVEDLDIGYRAWQHGWSSVYVNSAAVEHRHRATTSRYYTEEQLAAVLERNYLRFLLSAVTDAKVFQRLWKEALHRLRLKRDKRALREAAQMAWAGKRAGAAPRESALPEELVLALTNGTVTVFPGRPASGNPRVLIATPYLPFPLAHGGAVRMYNLMRRVASEFDLLLVAFCETDQPPAEELLAICAEVVLVRREGTHAPPSTGRPDVVEEFSSASFRGALRQTVRKWLPGVAQLEFTQMAQYAEDCAPARTILVEHDITLDLYGQLLALHEDWELRRQLLLWQQFERNAWRRVSCVITMSEKDRAMIPGSRAVTLPNGVDLDRFRPGVLEPEPRRLLFIGSFAHLPNLMAAEFFLNQVWPHLHNIRLHIIAGARYDYYLEHYSDRVKVDLGRVGVELEGFVADVRPAYERAAVVVAPLVASAGTNIKILEAMAMGKAIVSTPAGVNGLDLSPGDDFVLVKTAEEMAAAIKDLLGNSARRNRIEAAARRRVESSFGWDEIARQQAELYREIL